MRTQPAPLWLVSLALIALAGCPPTTGSPSGDARTASDSGDGTSQQDADGDRGDSSSPTCIDRDGDGYGAPSSSDLEQCPACTSGMPGGCEPDCDDTDDRIFPSATERCNGVDDNCNDIADEAIGNSSCIENGECPLASSDPPQDGTEWGCAVVGGTMQCVLKGTNAGGDATCTEEDAYGTCEEGSWTDVPDQCT